MFKKITLSLLILFLLINQCLADCDWKTGISPQGDSFIYTKDCHLEVGKLVKERQLRDEEVVKLNKVIELKDLYITTSEKRVELWKDTSFKLEDRLISQAKWSSVEKWVYLGIGIVTTIGIGFAVSYGYKH